MSKTGKRNESTGEGDVAVVGKVAKRKVKPKRRFLVVRSNYHSPISLTHPDEPHNPKYQVTVLPFRTLVLKPEDWDEGEVPSIEYYVREGMISFEITTKRPSRLREMPTSIRPRHPILRNAAYQIATSDQEEFVSGLINATPTMSLEDHTVDLEYLKNDQMSVLKACLWLFEEPGYRDQSWAQDRVALIKDRIAVIKDMRPE